MRVVIGMLLGAAMALGGYFWIQAGMPVPAAVANLGPTIVAIFDDCGTIRDGRVVICPPKRHPRVLNEENFAEIIEPSLAKLREEQRQARADDKAETDARIDSVSATAKAATDLAKAANKKTDELRSLVFGTEGEGGLAGEFREALTQIDGRFTKVDQDTLDFNRQVNDLHEKFKGVVLIDQVGKMLDRTAYQVREEMVRDADDIAKHFAEQYVDQLRKELAAAKPVVEAPLPPQIPSSPPAVRPAPRIIPVVPVPEEKKSPTTDTTVAAPRVQPGVRKPPTVDPSIYEEVGGLRLAQLTEACGPRHQYSTYPRQEAVERLYHLDPNEIEGLLRECRREAAAQRPRPKKPSRGVAAQAQAEPAPSVVEDRPEEAMARVAWRDRRYGEIRKVSPAEVREFMRDLADEKFGPPARGSRDYGVMQSSGAPAPGCKRVKQAVDGESGTRLVRWHCPPGTARKLGIN